MIEGTPRIVDKKVGTPGGGTVTSVSGVNSVKTTPTPITGVGTVELVNDSATPGNNFTYGTDAAGVKGWIPATGGQADWFETNTALPGFIKNHYVTQYAFPNGSGVITGTTNKVNWIYIQEGTNNLTTLAGLNHLEFDEIVIAPIREAFQLPIIAIPTTDSITVAGVWTNAVLPGEGVTISLSTNNNGTKTVLSVSDDGTNTTFVFTVATLVTVPVDGQATFLAHPDITITSGIGTNKILLANGATSIHLDGDLREWISVRWDKLRVQYIQNAGKQIAVGDGSTITGTGVVDDPFVAIGGVGAPINSITSHNQIVPDGSDRALLFNDAIPETYANMLAIKNGTAQYVAYKNETIPLGGWAGTLTSSSGGSATILSYDQSVILINNATGTFLAGDTINDGTNSADLLAPYPLGQFQDGYYMITDPDGGNNFPNTNFVRAIVRVQDNIISCEGYGLFANGDFQHIGNYTAVNTNTGIGTFLGNWTGTVPGPVTIGDIVFDDGVSNLYYTNFTGTNTATSPATDSTNWQPVAFTNGYNGAWSAAPSVYRRNQIAVYNGTHWANITGVNTSTPPGSDPTNWLPLPYTLGDGLGYIYEWDEIKYDFEDDFMTIREDSRGNKIEGPMINLWQWGNDNVLANTYAATGLGTGIINQGGIIIANEFLGQMVLRKEFNRAYLFGNKFSGACTIDLQHANGVITSSDISGNVIISGDTYNGVIDACIIKGGATMDVTSFTGTFVATEFSHQSVTLASDGISNLLNSVIQGTIDMHWVNGDFVPIALNDIFIDPLSYLDVGFANGFFEGIVLYRSYANLSDQQPAGSFSAITLIDTEFVSQYNSGTIGRLLASDSSITDGGAVGYSGTMSDNRFNKCLISFDDASGQILSNDLNEIVLDLDDSSVLFSNNQSDFGQVYLTNAAGYVQQSYFGRGTIFAGATAYVGNTSQLILDSGATVDASSMDGVLSQTTVETAGSLDVSTMTPDGSVSLCRISSNGLMDASVLEGYIEGVIVEQSSVVDASTMTITGTLENTTVTGLSSLSALLNSGDVWENYVQGSSALAVDSNSGVIEANFIKRAGSMDCTNNTGDVITCEVSSGNFNLNGNAGNIYDCLVNNASITAPRGTNAFSLEYCRFEDAQNTMIIPPFESFSNEVLVRGKSTFQDVFPIWGQPVPHINVVEKEYAGVIKILQSDEMIVTGVTGTFLTGETVSAPGFTAKVAMNPAFSPGSLILINITGVATPTDTITGDFSGATATIGISSSLSTQTYPLMIGIDGNHPVKFYTDPAIPSDATLTATSAGGAGLNAIVLTTSSLNLRNNPIPDFVVMEYDPSTTANYSIIEQVFF